MQMENKEYHSNSWLWYNESDPLKRIIYYHASHDAIFSKYYKKNEMEKFFGEVYKKFRHMPIYRLYLIKHIPKKYIYRYGEIARYNNEPWYHFPFNFKIKYIKLIKNIILFNKN